MFGPADLQGVHLGPQPDPGRLESVDLGHDPVALGLSRLHCPASGLLQHPLPIGFRLGPHERALVLGLLDPGSGVAVGSGELGLCLVGRLGQSLLRLPAGRLDDRTGLLAGLAHRGIGRALGQRQHLVRAGPGLASLAVLAVAVGAVAPDEGFSGRGPLLEFHEPALELGRRLGHRDDVGVYLGGVVAAKALAELDVLEKIRKSFHGG